MACVMHTPKAAVRADPSAGRWPKSNLELLRLLFAA